eukprot:XP_017949426.1 PREDICTED: KH domain-containing, RNA-binding, signal transduction-associated protein 2 isoform X2 [Xenopus tropicalis]
MEEEKYLPELMAEKDSLDPSFVHAMRLLDEEIVKFQDSEGNKEDGEKKYLDIISNKNIKLSERVLIPVKQYPKFNFVGKLLGPRGNSLKRLQEETGAKMSILGKGSMRDKIKDYNDEIRQEQLRELSYLNGSDDSDRGKGTRGRGIRVPSTPSRNRGGVISPAFPGRGASATRGAPITRGTISTVARGIPTPRAKAAPTTPGYRLPPPLTIETNDDYGYDDGFGEDYDEQSYDIYENNYNSQTQSVSEYYDYEHGTNEESYNHYEQEEWSKSRSTLKAPLQRPARAGYREHPYGRY